MARILTSSKLSVNWGADLKITDEKIGDRGEAQHTKPVSPLFRSDAFSRCAQLLERIEEATTISG